MKTVSNIIKTISDDLGLQLLELVATNDNIDTIQIMTKLKLTRKQYYTRMSKLIEAGLVVWKSGNYSLSSFGKVVYDAQNTIMNGIINYWKLKTIDSMSLEEMPKRTEKDHSSNGK
jgi:predicted transcriptional regulator